MSHLVRGDLRTNRWLEALDQEPHNLPADTLTDLRTSGDRLSVFEISDAVGAERIAIAVLAGKQNPSHTGYAIFDSAAVDALGIPITESRGSTYDSGVNELHRDLDVGTGGKLLQLAWVIAQGSHQPILKKQAERLLKEGFEGGVLDAKKNSSLARKVGADVPGL